MSTDHATQAAFIAVLWFALATLVPTAIAAQDCGMYCGPCLESAHEGYQHDADSSYDMACTLAGECDECEKGGQATLVADAPPSARAIMNAVSTTTPQRVGAIVEQYRDYLLLHPSRRLLAIRGTSSCDQDVIVAVVYLTAELTEALDRSGVRGLDAFLEELRSESSESSARLM